MALVIGTPGNTGFTLGATENFILPANVVVNAAGYGLVANIVDHIVIIQGTLIGADGIDLTGNNAKVIIEAGGVVAGTNDDAIELDAASATINNAGLITGKYGIYDSGAGLTTDLITINNTGRIISDLDSIRHSGVHKMVLTNSGTIQSYNDDAFYSGANAVSVVINKGSMFGDVALGGGADIYDGRGGRVVGVIGGGNDADKLTGGDLVDTMDGGAGIDILTGGRGKDSLTGSTEKDTFDFNAVVESGLTATTRDIIQDFVHGLDKIDLSTIDANTATAVSAFGLLAKGTATSVVGSGKIGWYQINDVDNSKDMTILRINNDADAAIEMTIQLKGLIALTSVDFVL